MLKIALKLWFCALLMVALPAASAVQQEPSSNTAAVSEFVQSVLSRAASPSAIAVSFQNVSSLSPEAQEALQNAVLNGFRTANVKLVKAEQAVADVQITFSEDWQGYVWLANIQMGSSSQLVIKKLPRQQRATSSRAPTLWRHGARADS